MAEIIRFSDENDYTRKQRQVEYRQEYKKTFGDDPPPFMRYFNFHDCNILSYYKQGNDLVIEKNSSIWNIEIDKVIFKNCKVIMEEGSLIGAEWLYDEIYKAKNGYEIHVLLNKNGSLNNLLYFTVITEDVEYIK